MDEPEETTIHPVEPELGENSSQELPSGIVRLREEWRLDGLPIYAGTTQQSDAQVVFPESGDGLPIGDYALTEDDVRSRLRLSQPALDRLILYGELDSILVREGSGTRRLVSISSLERFEAESAMEPQPETAVPKSLLEAIESLMQEIDQLKTTQAKQIQQVKDMVLLELRNLKEQERDLSSYVYEMTQVMENLLPKRKKRR